MNAIVPVPQSSGGLIPASMSEAMKLAEMMAGAKLVPVGLQKSPADCLMVIQQAVRWQLDPFAVAQECSVIQGKLMHSGKLVAAVVNARGNLTQRLSFEYKGAGQERSITVSGQLQGEPQPRTVEVILKNAATSNKVWQTQPDQQLMYHGVRVWARRHTPELMLGVYSPEEFDEPAPVQRKPSRPAPNVMLAPLLDHDPTTGEVIEPVEPSPRTAVTPAAGQAAPDNTPLQGTGAAEAPSYDTYCEQWAAIVAKATNAQQLAEAWNGQKDLRNKILWPDDASRLALQKKVTDAISFLKVPA